MFILLSELCAVPTAQLALVHALTGVLQGIMVLAQTGPVPGSYSCTSALIQATLRTTFTLPMAYRLMLCSYDLTPVPWDFPKPLKTHPSSKTVTDRCIHRLAARQLGAYQYSRYSIERLAPQTSLFAPTPLYPKCYTWQTRWLLVHWPTTLVFGLCSLKFVLLTLTLRLYGFYTQCSSYWVPSAPIRPSYHHLVWFY